MTPRQAQLSKELIKIRNLYRGGQISQMDAGKALDALIDTHGGGNEKLKEKAREGLLVKTPKQHVDQSLSEVGDAFEHAGTLWTQGVGELAQESGRRSLSEKEREDYRVEPGAPVTSKIDLFGVGGNAKKLMQEAEAKQRIPDRPGPTQLQGVSPSFEAYNAKPQSTNALQDVLGTTPLADLYQKHIHDPYVSPAIDAIKKPIKEALYDYGNQTLEENKADMAKVPPANTMVGQAAQSIPRSFPATALSLGTGAATGGLGYLGGKVAGAGTQAAMQVAGRVGGTSIGLAAAPNQLAAEATDALTRHPLLKQEFANLNDAEVERDVESLKSLVNELVFDEKFLSWAQVLQAGGALPIGGWFARMAIDSATEGIEEGLDDTVIVGTVVNEAVKRYLRYKRESPMSNSPDLVSNKLDWIKQNQDEVIHAGVVGSIASGPTNLAVTTAERLIEGKAPTEQDRIVNETKKRIEEEQANDPDALTKAPELTEEHQRLMNRTLNRYKSLPKEDKAALFKEPDVQVLIEDILNKEAVGDPLTPDQLQLSRLFRKEVKDAQDAAKPEAGNVDPPKAGEQPTTDGMPYATPNKPVETNTDNAPTGQPAKAKSPKTSKPAAPKPTTDDSPVRKAFDSLTPEQRQEFAKGFNKQDGTPGKKAENILNAKSFDELSKSLQSTIEKQQDRLEKILKAPVKTPEADQTVTKPDTEVDTTVEDSSMEDSSKVVKGDPPPAPEQSTPKTKPKKVEPESIPEPAVESTGLPEGEVKNEFPESPSVPEPDSLNKPAPVVPPEAQSVQEEVKADSPPEVKQEEVKAPENLKPDEPVRITGAYDAFKTNNAPYIIEERTNSYGGTYDKRVYTSEAYKDFMDTSDETNQRIRWGVQLNDGRTVSVEGAVRITKPEAYKKIKKNQKQAKKMGAVWKLMDAQEREAMRSQIPIETEILQIAIEEAEKAGKIWADKPTKEKLNVNRENYLHWATRKYLVDNQHPFAEVWSTAGVANAVNESELELRIMRLLKEDSQAQIDAVQVKPDAVEDMPEANAPVAEPVEDVVAEQPEATDEPEVGPLAEEPTTEESPLKTDGVYDAMSEEERTKLAEEFNVDGEPTKISKHIIAKPVFKDLPKTVQERLKKLDVDGRLLERAKRSVTAPDTTVDTTPEGTPLEDASKPVEEMGRTPLPEAQDPVPDTAQPVSNPDTTIAEPADTSQGLPEGEAIQTESPKTPTPALVSSKPAALPKKVASTSKKYAKLVLLDLDLITSSHDLDGAVNEGYATAGGVQPRDDRTALAADDDLQKMVAEPEAPRFLSNSPDPGVGAPIITTGGAVLSGNNRTRALQYLKQQDIASFWADYDRNLLEDAEALGFDRAELEQQLENAVNEGKRLVMVRQFDGDLDGDAAAKIADMENDPAVSARSDAQKAKKISDKLTATDIPALLTEDGIAVTNKSSIDRVRKLLSDEDQKLVFDQNGNLTNAGVRLMTLALIEHAYGRTVTNRVALDQIPSSQIKALVQAVPTKLRMDQAINALESDTLTEMDITEQWMTALPIYAQLDEDERINKDFSNILDYHTFEDPIIPMLVKAMRNGGRKASIKSMATRLKTYNNRVADAATPMATEQLNKEDLVREIFAEGEEQTSNQGSLFNEVEAVEETVPTKAGGGLTVDPNTPRGKAYMNKRMLEVMVDVARETFANNVDVQVVATLKEAQKILGRPDVAFGGVSYTGRDGTEKVMLVADVLEAEAQLDGIDFLKRGVEIYYHESVGHAGLKIASGGPGQFKAYNQKVYNARKKEIDKWHRERYKDIQYKEGKVVDADWVKASEWLAQNFAEKGLKPPKITDRLTFNLAGRVLRRRGTNAEIRLNYDRIYQNLTKGRKPKLRAIGQDEIPPSEEKKPRPEVKVVRPQKTEAQKAAEALQQQIRQREDQIRQYKEQQKAAQSKSGKEYFKRKIAAIDKELKPLYEQLDPNLPKADTATEPAKPKKSEAKKAEDTTASDESSQQSQEIKNSPHALLSETTPYANAPDSLMGFAKEGRGQKSYDESNYKKEITVKVTFPDGVSITDGMKGLNTPHAMERARRNWPGAEIEMVSDQPLFSEAPPTRSEEFQEWFGDSKLVNQDGTPRRMYHGTGSDIKAFNLDIAQDQEGRKYFLGLGAGKLYLTGEAEVANLWAKNSQERRVGRSPNVLPLYVRLENPITGEEYHRRYRELNGTEMNDEFQSQRQRDSRIQKLDTILKKEGVDGIWDVYYNPDGSISEVLEAAVFDPTQIKSIFNESPSRDNDDLLFSEIPSDKEYMDAVNRGDMEAAQEMVNQAAEAKGYNLDNDYHLSHKAPNSKYDVSLLDLRDSDLLPNDYFTHPQYYTYDGMSRDAHSRIAAALRKVDALRKAGRDGMADSATMWVYRARPKNREESPRNGNWVTPSKDYAKQHMAGEKGWHIQKMRAKLSDLYFDGNDPQELGYDTGENLVYGDTRNNRKRIDPVTYDAEGNVIPLSKRFNKREYSTLFSETNQFPEKGINVRSDKKAGRQYADLIVDGQKTYESRNSDSLRPYVGKRVSIVRTGEGKAQAIGAVTIGEPILVGEAKFRALEDQHMVPAGSDFDIRPGGTKYLYPLKDPVRVNEQAELGRGIVSRKVTTLGNQQGELFSEIEPVLQEMVPLFSEIKKASASGTFFDPKANLQGRKEYDYYKQRFRGQQFDAIKLGKFVGDIFYRAVKPGEQAALYEYFTTPDADPNQIPDRIVKSKWPTFANTIYTLATLGIGNRKFRRNYGSLRDAAIKAKSRINEHGEALVNLGMLPPETLQRYGDQYLPKIYLRYLLSPDHQKVITAGGSLKASQMNYLKKRRDTDPVLMAVFGQELKDPAYLSALTIIQQGKDLALMRFLKELLMQSTPVRDDDGNIVEEARQNWVLEDRLIDVNYADIVNQVIQQKGLNLSGDRLPQMARQTNSKKLSPEFVASEANRLNGVLDDIYAKDSTLGQLVEGVAAKLNQLANQQRTDTTEYNVQDYAKLPDSPRYGVLRGMWVRKEIEQELVNSAGMPNSDDISAFMRMVTRNWKWLVVAANPVAWAGNVASNTFNMMVGAGLDPVRGTYYRLKAINELMRMYQGNTSARLRRYEKEGLTLSTFASNELDRLEANMESRIKIANRGLMSGSASGMYQAWKVFQDFMADRYQDLELMDKIAIAMHQESKGKSAAEAIRQANHHLFDYTEVPNWIQSGALGRNSPLGAPFITWMYKFTGWTAEQLNPLKNPMAKIRLGMYTAMLAGAREMMKADLDDEEEDLFYEGLPEYLQRKGRWFVIPYKERDANGKVIAVDISMWFPLQTLISFGVNALPNVDGVTKDLKNSFSSEKFGLANALSDVGLMGSPIIGAPMEVINNRNSFTGAPVHDQYSDLAEVDMAVHLIKQFTPYFALKVADYVIGGGSSMTTDRMGNPKSTLGVETGKLSGFRSYSVDIDQGRYFESRRISEAAYRAAAAHQAKVNRGLTPAEEAREERALEKKLKNYERQLKKLEGEFDVEAIPM